MVPRPISNPPNPWLSTEVEYLEEIPPAELEVYEDHTREILAHNDSPDVGFSWSVNPYRGCFHACAYCLSGETRILMGDRSTRPLVELRTGDVIYGTVISGDDRRYVRTTVLAHWKTEKRAFRIVLEDGTTLVASGDHRFLTEVGWRRVADPSGLIRERFPSIAQARNIETEGLKSAAKLGVASVEPLGVDLPMYDITTGTGDFIANGVVSHNCYARPTHEYLGFSAGLDFETKILVKPDAPELLEEAFRRPSWEPQVVALSGNTDCYQPVERRLGLTRRCLEVFLKYRNPVALITKSSLVTRDLDLLGQLAALDLVSVTSSVTTLDPELARG